MPLHNILTTATNTTTHYIISHRNALCASCTVPMRIHRSRSNHYITYQHIITLHHISTCRCGPTAQSTDLTLHDFKDDGDAGSWHSAPYYNITLYIYIHTYVYACVCVYIYIYIYTHVCRCVYIYMHMYYVYTYVCVYIYIHIYI